MNKLLVVEESGDFRLKPDPTHQSLFDLVLGLLVLERSPVLLFQDVLNLSSRTFLNHYVGSLLKGAFEEHHPELEGMTLQDGNPNQEGCDQAQKRNKEIALELAVGYERATSKVAWYTIIGILHGVSLVNYHLAGVSVSEVLGLCLSVSHIDHKILYDRRAQTIHHSELPLFLPLPLLQLCLLFLKPEDLLSPHILGVVDDSGETRG